MAGGSIPISLALKAEMCSTAGTKHTPPPPRLFNIYMKPVREVIRRLRVLCHQYRGFIGGTKLDFVKQEYWDAGWRCMPLEDSFCCGLGVF